MSCIYKIFRHGETKAKSGSAYELAHCYGSDEARLSRQSEICSPTAFLDIFAIVGDTRMQLSRAEVRAIRRAAMDRADRRAENRKRRIARRRALHRAPP
jgi:hypothetical protein